MLPEPASAEAVQTREVISMDLLWRRRKTLPVGPPADPAVGGAAPWPWSVVLGLAIAGVISPLIAVAAAVLAYAFADKDQGTLLIGAGLVHVLVALTFLSGS